MLGVYFASQITYFSAFDQAQWLEFHKLRVHRSVPSNLETIYRCVTENAGRDAAHASGHLVHCGGSLDCCNDKAPSDSVISAGCDSSDVESGVSKRGETEAQCACLRTEDSQAEGLSSSLCGDSTSSSQLVVGAGAAHDTRNKLWTDILEFCKTHFLFARCSERCVLRLHMLQVWSAVNSLFIQVQGFWEDKARADCDKLYRRLPSTAVKYCLSFFVCMLKLWLVQNGRPLHVTVPWLGVYE